MVRLFSAGSLLVAFGLFAFAVTRLVRDVVADNELAIAGALRTIHYAYPIIMLFYFVLSSMMTVFTFKSLRKASHPKTAKRKRLVLWLSGAILFTYVLQGILLMTKSSGLESWKPSTHENVYVLSSILMWSILQVSILDSTYVIWYPYSGCWYISIVLEALLLLLVDLRATHIPKLAGFAWITVIGLRIILLILLPLLFYTLPQTNNQPITPDFDEERGLLCKQRESGVDVETDDNLGIYGSFFDTESDDERTKKTKAKLHTKWQESGNWWNYAKSFSVFWPMIWPSNNKKLKSYMFLISLILIGQSALNLLVPRQFGLVTDSFLDGSASSPWAQVSLFIVFKLLQSNAGLFALKDYLWVPIEQYSYRMITTSAYNHILSLSYDFHCDKRSGELFASISNARSINLFIDMMLFRFIPMLVDLFIAFVYLYCLFGPYMALLVAFVTISFLWSTSKMANYNQCIRRDFIKASRKEGDTMWETVSNWQNISYFNNLEYEQNKYMGAVVDYQKLERKWIWGTSSLKVLQSLIFTVGLLGASYLAVYAIMEKTQPVGSFVTLLLYWTQLSGPLAFFADFFRRLNTSMIDAERVLEILSLKPTVTDRRNAPKLDVKDGEVAFDTVHFDYDERKPALRGISFRAKPGQTVAVVGETGAGKSTILRLLFRFYDVKKGAIKIDGQDVRDVTLESLRDAIGVVPQDPTLFNDTIMNNLRYANFEATDSDIYKACEAAAIHSQIESFPDGYNTIVGERGVKLSGGELQRIAIARAIIKNPKIILLDEATSMVDMYTERCIQTAFNELKKGRTTFVIAHRLSTIVNADQIVVVHGGKIKEIGTHDDLLNRRDAYYKLWNKQIRQHAGADEPASKFKSSLVNDILPAHDENTKGKNVPTIPPPQASGAITGNTTLYQSLELRQTAPAMNIPVIPQLDGAARATRPASLPHYNNTMPNISRRHSTLKADAPEYVPSTTGSLRSAPPPVYSAINRSGDSRVANAASVPANLAIPDAPQVSAQDFRAQQGQELPNENKQDILQPKETDINAKQHNEIDKSRMPEPKTKGDPNNNRVVVKDNDIVIHQEPVKAASDPTAARGAMGAREIATFHGSEEISLDLDPGVSLKQSSTQDTASKSIVDASDHICEIDLAPSTPTLNAQSHEPNASDGTRDKVRRPRFRYRPRRNLRGHDCVQNGAKHLPQTPEVMKAYEDAGDSTESHSSIKGSNGSDPRPKNNNTDVPGSGQALNNMSASPTIQQIPHYHAD
ncbi:hypothetical protein DRE_03697 [Drechslerella stenobrocha 248]|uniref:Heavy metal tolerance protein n=1 Tax=Drechslerella stenobrocha 248 TaxID=1043628 RepID=W7ICS2_9PEZI|nr:hypothetical protein DRE_03697 [Drechslerella stenobrocha 248]